MKIVNKKIFILSHIGFIVMTVLLSWAYTSNIKADDTVAQIVNALLGLSGMLVILPWVIVLSPLIWTDEYQYGTLKQLFLHTSSHSRLYVAKIAAMILLIITGVVNIFIVSFLANLLVSPQNIQWGDMTDVIYSIGAIVLQCCLYASLASLIGVWTRSAAIAAGSSLVLYFLQMIFGGSLVSISWTHILFIHHDDLSVY
ncbi:ABC transporter permease, partial [Bacillus wiedmannii]|uniref:ABC transporter permease n=1 Tax=Bacillus wiedmannii TaxID=1890302 RepID=UPI000BF4173C